MCRPSNINVFQWNGECFFLRHIELNSRFIVMTIDDVTLNRQNITMDFSVICWFCWLRLFPFALNFSTEIFTPYWLFPSKSWCSEFVISSWQFCCSVCNWEYEFIIFLSDQYFFRVDSSGIDIWCVHLFQIFQVGHQDISFPNSLRDQLIAKKDSRWYFLAKLMNSWLIFRWRRMIFNHCSKRYYWPFDWFSKTSFVRRFPICQEVLSVSQIAMTFHRIWSPSFIQSWLEQYCWRTFLYSPDGSFSDAICLGSMRCWLAVIPWQNPHMPSQIPSSCPYFQLFVLSTVPIILTSFFPSHVQILWNEYDPGNHFYLDTEKSCKNEDACRCATELEHELTENQKRSGHLRIWDLIFQRQQGEKWKGNHWIRRLNHLTKQKWNFGSYKWNLFSRWYDGLSENSCYGMESWKNAWLYGISKLDVQVQNWSLYANSRSSGHNAVDQRSWSSLMKWQTRHIAIDYRTDILMISICLIRWLRQLWRSSPTRSQPSERK